ncbi:MAG TPA: hypothetical protein VNA20_12795 [Frankiaceae bacterium]|nr:hypothetical protein [Frankiaceae bacterium]
MADIAPAGPPAPRKRTTPAVALVGAGLVGGVVLAGLTTANAQSGQPTPTPSEAPGAPDKQPGQGKRDKQGKQGKHFGGPGMHLGRGALHGEFVTKDADGGFRTMAMQNGEVTAVSPTSITVRSEDGYSRTYAVTGDTTVVSANDGIGDVAQGDTVHVGAEVAGGTATAIRIVDVTEADRLRERWGFRDKGARKPGAPAASPSSG